MTNVTFRCTSRTYGAAKQPELNRISKMLQQCTSLKVWFKFNHVPPIISSLQYIVPRNHLCLPSKSWNYNCWTRHNSDSSPCWRVLHVLSLALYLDMPNSYKPPLFKSHCTCNIPLWTSGNRSSSSRYHYSQWNFLDAELSSSRLSASFTWSEGFQRNR